MNAKSLQLCPILWDPMDLRLLFPWDSPGKNTGVGGRALLQRIFPTQESNPCLLCLSSLAGGFFTTSATWEAKETYGFSQSFPSLLFPYSLLDAWDFPPNLAGQRHLHPVEVSCHCLTFCSLQKELPPTPTLFHPQPHALVGPTWTGDPLRFSSPPQSHTQSQPWSYLL